MTGENLLEPHIPITCLISTLIFSRPSLEEEKGFLSISLSDLDFLTSRFPQLTLKIPGMELEDSLITGFMTH